MSFYLGNYNIYQILKSLGYPIDRQIRDLREKIKKDEEAEAEIDDKASPCSDKSEFKK